MHMIDRIIHALGQEATISLISNVIGDLVRNDDWRCRHAALMALSQVGEYVDDIIQMDPIVNFILNFSYDSHPKVRFAVMHALGQISDDMHPEFQERFHEQVLPVMQKSLKDGVQRVVAHTLAAMTNFIEGSKKAHVSGKIKDILIPCLDFLKEGISLVKENAMSTIAALAEAANFEFTEFWKPTAEVVFSILQNSTKPEYKQLRGQAIECLTLIGVAIGKNEFIQVAREIIQVMLDIQLHHVEETDPQKSYLLSGW